MPVSFLLLLIIRLERDGARYFREGEAYSRQGIHPEAYFRWKMAVQMYVPFSPNPPKVARRLLSAADEALARGSPEDAARALSYLRAGLLSLRHVRQPMAAELAEAERRLAALAPEGRRTEEAERLAERHGARLPGTLLLAAGLSGWALSVVRLLRRWGNDPGFRALREFLPPLLFLALMAAGILLA